MGSMAMCEMMDELSTVTMHTTQDKTSGRTQVVASRSIAGRQHESLSINIRPHICIIMSTCMYAL